MVPDAFIEDIDKLISRYPEKDRNKFYEEVNNCIEDASWLREHRLNPNNNNRDIVIKILYSQLY